MRKTYTIVAIVLIAAGILLASSMNGIHTSDRTKTTSMQNSANGVVQDSSDKALTTVSSTIYTKTDTTTLLLSNNSIRSLPSQMGKMINLTVLKIDHNQLNGNLIGEIRQMTKLRTLNVSYNNMTGMPAELGQLHSLESLDYSNNKITGLPNEIEQLKDNLKEFDLTGNPLSIEQISKIKIALPNTKIIF